MISQIKMNTVIGTLVALCLLVILGYVATQTESPAFDYADSSIKRELVPLSEFDSIADLSASFLWGHRVLDLIGQAFVIVAAVVCCLALLKQTESAH
jgi:hypothetical protein